jgi:hypothetical protein
MTFFAPKISGCFSYRPRIGLQANPIRAAQSFALRNPALIPVRAGRELDSLDASK